ncbi:MAG TPA: crosslink repair DNA glycosylase YcaQ family protein, partial [Chloroflexia bacterium]|nr:crosslink repair DNA glycosylase YcaQ family protein [Chloroflexia bacterium]
VVLVDGVVRGVWEQETKKGQTLVKVSMFAAPTKKVRSGIEAEAARLEGFLGTKVAVESA